MEVIVIVALAMSMFSCLAVAALAQELLLLRESTVRPALSPGPRVGSKVAAAVNVRMLDGQELRLPPIDGAVLVFALARCQSCVHAREAAAELISQHDAPIYLIDSGDEDDIAAKAASAGIPRGHVSVQRRREIADMFGVQASPYAIAVREGSVLGGAFVRTVDDLHGLVQILVGVTDRPSNPASIRLMGG